MRSTLLLTILASPLTTVTLSAQTDAATPLPIGTAYRTSLALGDVTGDGRVDLVIGRNGPFVLRRGTGEPQAPFGREEPLDASVEPSCDSACPPQLADLDGDGDLDLAATDTPLGSDGHFAWFANDGRGRFGPKQRLGDANGAPLVCAWRTKAMALGDWDGDGRLDLFFVDGEGQVHVQRGRANGFEAAADLGVRSDGPLGFADWSGDGRADLVSRVGSAVVVHERGVDGRFGEARGIATVAEGVLSVQFAVGGFGEPQRLALFVVETHPEVAAGLDGVGGEEGADGADGAGRADGAAVEEVMATTARTLVEEITKARERLEALRPAAGDAKGLARWRQHQEALARWLEGLAAYGGLAGSVQRESVVRLRVVRKL